MVDVSPFALTIFFFLKNVVCKRKSRNFADNLVIVENQ